VAGIVGWRGMMGLTDQQVSVVRRAFEYADPDDDDDEEEALGLAIAVYLSFSPLSFGQAGREVKLLLACCVKPGSAVPTPGFRKLMS
jgi:hypothetical protein